MQGERKELGPPCTISKRTFVLNFFWKVWRKKKSNGFFFSRWTRWVRMGGARLICCNSLGQGRLAQHLKGTRDGWALRRDLFPERKPPHMISTRLSRFSISAALPMLCMKFRPFDANLLSVKFSQMDLSRPFGSVVALFSKTAQSEMQDYVQVFFDPKWKMSWKHPGWQLSGVRLECLANKSGWLKAFGLTNTIWKKTKQQKAVKWN